MILTLAIRGLLTRRHVITPTPGDEGWKDSDFPTLAQLEQQYWESLNATERKIEARNSAGLEYLRLGQLQDAVDAFDEVKELSYGQRYAWQRGIALYYLDRFDEALSDFTESISKYERRFEEVATEERIMGAAAARLAGKALELPTDLKETRPIFRILLDIFEGGSPTEFKKIVRNDRDQMQRILYSHYYTGIYWESRGDPVRANAHITLADRRAKLQTETDLILSLPELHLKLRAWHPPSDDDLNRASLFD